MMRMHNNNNNNNKNMSSPRPQQSLMIYLVMPHYTRLLQRWLFA